MSPAVRAWNRRIHILAGLALLLFVMLFSATGLLLNHHWAFAEFWDRRQVRIEAARFAPPPPALNGVAQAREILGRLGLRGEVQTLKTTPGGGLTLQASRPGELLKIEADLRTGQARIERTHVNGWGVARAVHTFIGVSQAEPERRRDWWLTKLWSLAVDLTAVGLILLVIGGLVEAWAANARRWPLVLIFAAGALACLAFVSGLLG